MKKRVWLILVGVVVLFHVGLVLWLTRSRDAAAPDAAPAPPAAAAQPAAPPELTMASFRLQPVSVALPAALQTQAAQCTSGVLMDLSTGELLWARNADTPVPIASMTKMMTALLLMEAVHQERRVDMKTRIQVTPACHEIGGSQVWLDPRESFTVEELAKCLMIKSANDAAYLLGEHLAGGDHAAFVARMNGRARELGCSGMVFYNSHGLPPGPKAPENQATARELALLGARLLQYPDLMAICAIRMDWLQRPNGSKTELYNHNTLISKRPCAGVDGIKTGYTIRSGHCVTASCLRNGRRLLAVVNGVPRPEVRDKLAAALFDWGYATQAARAPLKPAAAAPAAPAAAVPGR